MGDIEPIATSEEMDRLRGLLREVEWAVFDAFGYQTVCPICWGTKRVGHAHDCRLASATASHIQQERRGT